jgi:hypothetical protein
VGGYGFAGQGEWDEGRFAGLSVWGCGPGQTIAAVDRFLKNELDGRVGG